MNKNILKLSVVTMILFVLSILTFKWDHYRGVDLIAGSEFINTLNIDKVSKFEISGKNNKKLVFKRKDNLFQLENHSFYPAKSSEVSELFYKLSTLKVSEKVSSSKSSFKSYGVDKENSMYLFSFYDDSGNELLKFYVGNSYKGAQNYIRREGENDTYLTSDPINYSLDKKAFIEKNILKFEKDKVARLDFNGDVVIVKNPDGFNIEGLEKYRDEMIEDTIDDLSSVEFDDFFTSGHENVTNLQFNRGAEITLSNKMMYRIDLAKEKNRYFLKAKAAIDNKAEEVVLNDQMSNEKINEVNDIIKTQSGAQNFNFLYQDWVFEISEYEYNKFVKKIDEFKDET